jgi:hypothetical protein
MEPQTWTDYFLSFIQRWIAWLGTLTDLHYTC